MGWACESQAVSYSRRDLWGKNSVESDAVRGLVSLFLAAGNLTREPRPSGNANAQATLTGGLKDSAYLEEKVEEFRRFLPSTSDIRPFNPRGADYTGEKLVLRFRCRSPKLLPVYHLLYPTRKRYITSAPLELCAARGVAWMVAEHGKRAYDGLQLWSTADTAEEVVRIAQWMQRLTGTHCRVVRMERLHRPVILFPPDQAARLCEILMPYAPETRKNLFLLCMNDVDPVFDPDDLLLPGQGAAIAQRSKLPALVDAEEAGVRARLPEAPGKVASASVRRRLETELGSDAG